MDRMTLAGIALDSHGVRITNVDGIETYRYDMPPTPVIEVGPSHEGFRVRGPDEDPERYWTIELPHQCDEWTVACTPDPAEAIAEMEKFVSDAQTALAELRRRVSSDPSSSPNLS